MACPKKQSSTKPKLSLAEKTKKYMTTSELHSILRNLRNLTAENEIVEFKEAKNGYDFNKLGKYLSALSNEANLKGKPYAWLVFDVML